ncbi:hypothetical protein G9P44_002027 [Scheffersomyces stipitis]|nr:hypothetical protein G9P44_002027 [Scheffersomyces stipitis]
MDAAKKKIRRSRNGCHNCKRLKIKCDEQKPVCSYCAKTRATCDYSIKLTWGGRPYRDTNKRRKDQFRTIAFENDSSVGAASNGNRNTENVNINSAGNQSIQFFKVQAHDIIRANSSASNMSSDISVNSTNSQSSYMSFSSNTPSLKRTSHDAQLEDEAPASRARMQVEDIRSPSASPAFLTPGGESILSDFDAYIPKVRQYKANKDMAPSMPTPDTAPAIKKEYSSFIASSDIITDHLPHQSRHDREDQQLDQEQNENRQGQAEHANQAHKQGRSRNHQNHTVDFHQDENPEKQSSPAIPFSFVDSMPEISDGIESLSSALEKASNGGQQFLLHNSEIFNNFLSGNMDVKISEDVDDHSINSGDISEVRANPTQAAESKKFPNEDFFSSYSEDLARIEAYLPARSPNFGGDFFALSNSFRSFFQKAHKFSKLKDDDEDEIEPLDSENSENNLLSLSPSGSEQIPTPDEIFATIPPSITPLPEILLHVPFYRNLMHFWVNVASDHLVPAPPHLYKDNPFKILLPQMAMEYPSILTTLLAFSASIRSSLVGANDTPEIVTDQLLSRSCHELLKLLKDSKTATSDYTLATVLLLSCYEVFNSKDFNKHRAHTVGARQIIMARNQSAIKKEQSSVIGTESDITFFLMRWFVYVDIIGALSSTRNNHNYISKSDNIHSYTPAESVTTLNELDKHIEQNPKRDIDHLLGFDVKFLPQFSEIALLIRRTNSYLSREGVDKDAIPFEIVARALEVKENLMKAYEIGERRRQKKLDEAIDHRIQQKKKQTNSTSPPNLTHLIEHDNTIRTTNKIFCDTGILNLYRRVLKIPRESSLVQDLANNIGSMQMKYIESRSPADICTIFCTFAAGCETQDGKMQQFFNDRFSCLIEMGNVNALKGLKIMKRCWETGEDWIVASRTLDIDMALL